MVFNLISVLTHCGIGALIVYDITDQDSFTKVNTWIKELRKYLPGETPIIIAGNKCDMSNRVIPLEEAEKYVIYCKILSDSLYHEDYYKLDFNFGILRM